MRSAMNRKTSEARPQGGISVGSAVLLALYGAPHAAVAQQRTETGTGALAEVVVTATRRELALEAVPYSISVVGAPQLERTGVTDVTSLATQVPGLSSYDFGTRFSGATAPIIRGINATGTPRGFRTFEQDPVGTYINNSPIDGYYQFIDINRIEVLRGPQGTLYGAGSLGGALRIIPNSPKLGKWSAHLEAGASRAQHSSGTGYTFSGSLNAPFGDSLAFRVAGKYSYEPGFVDIYGLLKRTSSSISSIPQLANPADPIDSPGVFVSRSDWNWEKTLTARASLLWNPTGAFSAEAALMHANARGVSGPIVNRDFPGGAYPLDPRITFPKGGDYQAFSPVDQPFSRYSNLLSLDLSYDVGFATVSATSSYHTTSGSALTDNTYGIAGLANGFFIPYYSGIPANPRFILDQVFRDHAHTFTQEVRLVSNARPGNLFDYVLGGFYENQGRQGEWNIAAPGSPERSVLQGCTQPSFFGAAFPNCLIVVGPRDLTFVQIDNQSFRDKSVFGELTWHFTARGQVAFGVRHFSQDFTDAQSYLDYTFPTDIPASPHPAPASKTVGKVNPSFEYAPGHFAYAIWSQGFRRGGANSVPPDGIFRESPVLNSYAPDKTDNYEIGLRGRFESGLTYAFAVFDIKWDKPQISASLPSGNLAVYNGDTAESKGFELESGGRVFNSGLSYNFSFSYADAKLTSDFSLPANNGTGTIIPGLISGRSGSQLPGSPKTSVASTLSYERALAAGYDLSLSINGTYRTKVIYNVVPVAGSSSTGAISSSYQVFNFFSSIEHGPLRLTGYITNIFDRQEILKPPGNPGRLGGLVNDYLVNRPLEVGMRVGYSF